MRSNKLLWAVQTLLSLIFMAAGVVKFITPIEQMQQGPVALPGALLYFVGAAEVLGAAGLTLPGLFGVARGLVPLAAAGLTIIMVGAVGVTIWAGMPSAAVFPFVVGLMTVYVAWGRRGAGR
jgi:uncharacterized membrane protein